MSEGTAEFLQGLTYNDKVKLKDRALQQFLFHILLTFTFTLFKFSHVIINSII